MRAFFLVLLLAPAALAAPPASLSEALRKGQCQLRCSENGRAAGSILQAEVQNRSSQTLYLRLPEGALFVPLEPELQTRMVIDEELIELPPGAKQTVEVEGVCVEYGKPVPPAGGSQRPYLVTCPGEKPPGVPWSTFLQNDGIPSSRFAPTALDKMVQCAQIPDRARELQEAGKLHKDLGPRHLVTVIQRAVWTVCDGHDRQKIREDIQTQVRKSGGAQSEEQVKELADNLWSDVDLVCKKNIPISSTPEEPPRRLEDLDIHPIQVVQEPRYEELVESIPLVANKATCVRVFVRKPLVGIHTLKLTWLDQGMQQDEITAELIQYEGRTWVLPLNPASGPDHPTLKQYLTDAAITTPDADGGVPAERAKRWLENKSDTYFAFNFTFGAGRPCPSATLTLTADLRNQSGAVVASRTETSAGDFSICHVLKTYNVVVTAARTGGKAFRANTSQPWLNRVAADCKRQLLAVFPLAPGDIALTVDPIPATGVPSISAADRIAGPTSDSRAIASRFPTADAVLIVSPVNFPTGMWPFNSEYDGYTPAATDVVHYIDESVSFSTLVVAHEKGHDSRLLGSGHPTGGPILDAWDAGRQINSNAPESKTMTGRGWLMQQAKEGVASSVLNFIEQEEYKKLLRYFTDWGAL